MTPESKQQAADLNAQGLSNKAIAERLGCSAEAVRRALQTIGRQSAHTIRKPASPKPVGQPPKRRCLKCGKPVERSRNADYWRCQSCRRSNEFADWQGW